MLDIEVAYAKPEQQVIIALQLPEDTTLIEAIKISGLLDRFPEISQTDLNAGIFGNVYPLDQALKQGDRVEIYRPLQHDPKEARRRRAAKS
ncbi:MAG: RnfH family protein [Methylococcaceae bacterium]|nr:RnfH family protein [Methylococcaceae bacterium]